MVVLFTTKWSTRYQGWICLKYRNIKKKIQFSLCAKKKIHVPQNKFHAPQKSRCTLKEISCTLVCTSVHRADHWFNLQQFLMITFKVILLNNLFNFKLSISYKKKF